MILRCSYHPRLNRRETIDTIVERKNERSLASSQARRVRSKPFSTKQLIEAYQKGIIKDQWKVVSETQESSMTVAELIGSVEFDAIAMLDEAVLLIHYSELHRT